MSKSDAHDIAQARENGRILGQIETKIKVLCESSRKLEGKMDTEFEKIDKRLDEIEKTQTKIETNLTQCPILKGKKPWEQDPPSNPSKPDKLRKLKLWAVIITAVVGGGVTLPFIVKLLDGLLVIIKNAFGIGG